MNNIDKLNKNQCTGCRMCEQICPFDAIKMLNQISSKEELLEEKVKTTHNLDSFIKIDGDQIRVVIDSDDHSSSLANDIMRTIQSNFDTKQATPLPALFPSRASRKTFNCVHTLRRRLSVERRAH